MNVLVTGAGGFIGRHVVRRLDDAGHHVHAWTRDVCDLDDAARVRALVAAIRPDAAIHLAWYVEPGRWMTDVGHNLRSLEATLRLLSALVDNGCARIVLAGSGVEALDNDTTYAVAKRAVHEVAGHLARRGFGVVCAHLFSVFGPGEDGRRVVPTTVNAVLRGEPVDLTDGRQRRDYLYVEDVASALVAIAFSELTGTVDVTAGCPVELRALLLALAEQAGDTGLLRFGVRPYAADELTCYAGDPARLRALGWAPAYDVQAAATATVDWWRSVRERVGS